MQRGQEDQAEPVSAGEEGEIEIEGKGRRSNVCATNIYINDMSVFVHLSLL